MTGYPKRRLQCHRARLCMSVGSGLSQRCRRANETTGKHERPDAWPVSGHLQKKKVRYNTCRTTPHRITSGSIIQNSARWRDVWLFSARNVGPKVYTSPRAHAWVSTFSCPETVRHVRRSKKSCAPCEVCHVRHEDMGAKRLLVGAMGRAR